MRPPCQRHVKEKSLVPLGLEGGRQLSGNQGNDVLGQSRVLKHKEMVRAASGPAVSVNMGGYRLYRDDGSLWSCGSVGKAIARIPMMRETIAGVQMSTPILPAACSPLTFL